MAEQREKQLHKSYTKAAQKTADRIAEREADRVARLLGTTDKLQDALERAADELDRQMVKSRTRTRETVYGGAQAPESGKPVKETVREEEQIEIAEGLIDRLGLQQLKNETVEYKGEQIPRYVAQQRMREMERNVRRYRREAAVADDERAAGFLEKEREARARYVDFCKETGLKEQPERFRSANVFNNTNKSAESRDVLLKKIRNQESDYEQYEKYKAVLGENAPKSFADFQELKYNSGDGWAYTKQFTSYKRRVPEATEVDFQKYLQVKATGIIGTIRVPPEKIEVSKLVFRDKHAARHGCTVEEARGYVESAVCSIRRKKWDGESVNFYSLDGATYIDPETLQIKTSFPRKEFDPTTKAIAEVFE